MAFGTLREAINYYCTSKANIIQRGKRGSIPTKMVGGKKLYEIDEKYAARKKNVLSQKEPSKKALPKVKIKKEVEKEVEKEPEPDPVEIMTREVYEENFTIPKDILIDEVSNHLTDTTSVIKDLELVYDLTETDKALVEDFSEAYKSYRMLLDVANTEPVLEGYKANPCFRESREQYKMAMNIAEQIGLGAKNRSKLKLETKTVEVNPFAEFMQ